MLDRAYVSRGTGRAFFAKYFPGLINYGEVSYDGKYYSSYENQKVITLSRLARAPQRRRVLQSALETNK